MIKQPVEVILSVRHAEPLSMPFFDFSVSCSCLGIVMLLSKRFPAFGLERVGDAPNVILQCLHLLLYLVLPKGIAHQVTCKHVVPIFDAAVFLHAILVRFRQILQLLEVNFEIFLASDPILVVLCHLQWILDWRQWLYWYLINQVSSLKVLFEIQTKHWNRFASLIFCAWLIELCSNDMVDLGLRNTDAANSALLKYALSESERSKLFVLVTYLLVQELLAIKHELLQ